MKKFKIIAVIMITAILLCSCGGNKDTDVVADEEDLMPISSITIDEEEAAVLNEKVPVILYFADQEQTKLVKEIRYIDIKEAKKGAAAFASVMVKELIKGPEAKGLKPVIPEGCSLRSPVKIEDRVATVDFTKEFIDNHPGGKELAELTIYSVVNSLTELKDIERVKITINGKQTKNFKGQITLDSDFPRNEAVVNKEIGLAVPEDGALIPVSDDESDSAIFSEEDEDPLE
jgi:germination protein M